MNHPQFQHWRCARALFAVILLGTGAHALADTAAPAPLKVVIVDLTERGERWNTLYRLGIAARASNFDRRAQDAFHKIVDEDHAEARLAIPTGCPDAGPYDECASVRRIPDIDLPKAIAEANGSTLLVLWPEAAYFTQDQLFVAYVDVDIIKNGKVVPGTFYVGYRDWQCDEHCVPTAFEASAKELSAMVRYMLDLGPAGQTQSVPAAWKSKPVVTSVDKWANTCATEFKKERVVREYGQRFWLNDPANRTLTSTAWVGCNIFAANPR
jgi:hypothetical protein